MAGKNDCRNPCIHFDRGAGVMGIVRWWFSASTTGHFPGFPEAEPKNWDGLLGLQTRINYIVFIYIRTVRTTDFLSKKVASGFFVIRAACCPGIAWKRKLSVAYNTRTYL